MNKPEILAPAGSFDSLTAAVRCGADAVYLGGRELNARRNAANFSNEELAQAVEYCHARGVKVYITLNTLVRDDEMETAMNAVRCACDVKADALILQDIGLTSLIRKAAPDMPLHASTQTSVQTLDGIKMLADMGFCRAVLPRELSKKEIEKIAAQSPIELEMFVHGALCMCLSGQCQLSAVLGSRSGNRGLCAQPCRLPFAADGGTRHDLSLKDMSLIEYLPELAQMGVLSFKIEGRMKRPEYVAAAVTACKKSLAGESAAEYEHTLGAIFSRSGFTSGYYNGALGRDMFGVRRKEDVTAAKDVLSPLAALYDGEQPLIRADMHLSAQVGEKAYLAVKAAGKSVFAESENAVQKAQNRAVGSEEIETRLRKCGSTQFYAGEVGTDIGDDIFLSASEINSLRRKALMMLEEKIAERSEIPFYPQEISIRRRRSQNRGYVIRVRSISQIPSDLSYVRRVILPMGVGEETVKYLKDKKIQPAVEVSAAIFGGDDAVYNSLVKARKSGISLAAVCSLDGAAIAKKSGHEALRSARHKYIQHILARRVCAPRLHGCYTQHRAENCPVCLARRKTTARRVRLRASAADADEKLPGQERHDLRQMPQARVFDRQDGRDISRRVYAVCLNLAQQRADSRERQARAVRVCRLLAAVVHDRNKRRM